MRLRVALLLLGASLCLPAASKLTVEQLISFVRSAIQLKQPDKEVAAYLKTVTLTQRLTARTVEELQGEGAGLKTVEALNALSTASETLTAPPTPTPTPTPLPPPPPPSQEEQEKVLQQARDYAMNYTKSLPDFLCTQVTRRYVDPSGMKFWAPTDTLTARVAYVDHKEDYKLVFENNHAVANKSFYSVGGASSAGEFGSMMKDLFDPDTQATFHWVRWATLRGRRAHVYAYEVAQPRSKWHVGYKGELGERSTVPGYHGLVYVDREMLAIVRITLVADVPADFPLQDVQDTLDYDLAAISGNQYLLPLKAQVMMRDGRFLSKNDVEFRLYRKFSAEATITFTPEELPEDKTKEEPPK